MEMLLKLLLGIYVLYEGISMVTAIAGLFIIRNQIKIEFFNEMIKCQNGHFKIATAMLKTIFKISIAICFIIVI